MPKGHPGPAVDGRHALHLTLRAQPGALRARDTDTLSVGMKGFGVRLARSLNRARGRAGELWIDRYAVEILRSPAERQKLKFTWAAARA